MEQHASQQPSWAQALPGSVMPVSFAFSIARGKHTGWMLWTAEPEPYGYYSTYEECWAAATQVAVEIGRPYGELPFRPHQPQLAYHQPQQPAPQYNMPPAQPESFPNVVERERAASNASLADQIAKVQRGGVNGRAATVQVAYLCMAAAALWQIWPFGA